MQICRLCLTLLPSVILHLSTAGLLAQQTPSTPTTPLPPAPVPAAEALPAPHATATTPEAPAYEPSAASTVVVVALDDTEPLPLRWAALDKLRSLQMGTSTEERSAVLGTLCSIASRESDHPRLRLHCLDVIDKFLSTADGSTYNKSFNLLSSTSMSILQSTQTDDDVQIAAAAIAFKHLPNASSDARKVLLEGCRKAIGYSETLPRVREYLISAVPN